MSIRKYEIDMSQGSIVKSVIRFAVPLMLSNVLQVLYNAADVIVVGRWAGNNALASVGATGSLTALFINFFVGLSLGAGVLVSRKYGAKDSQGVHRAAHTSVYVSVIAGIIAMIVGVFFSRTLLELIGTPEGKVIDGATLYMKIIFLGAPATMVYNFGAAIMRGVGDTKRPFYILMTTGIINVLLNLVLVIVFHMDVAGVAIATIVANYLSAAAVIYYLMNSDGDYKICINKLRIYKEEFMDIIKVGFPAGLQSSAFSLSNTVIQSGVNSFGEAAVAGQAAAGNIEGFVYQAMNAFYQATITCVSQNYGAKRHDRLKKAVYTPLICASLVGGILGFLVVAFARPLLSIYITDSQAAIDFGIVRILVTTIPYFLVGIMEVLAGALRGLGYSKITLFNSIIGACGLRIVWVSHVLPLKRIPEVLFLCWPISWVVVITMHIITLLIVWKRAIRKINEV